MRLLWIAAFVAALVLTMESGLAQTADGGCSAVGEAGKRALAQFKGRNGLDGNKGTEWAYARLNLTGGPKFSVYTNKRTGADAESRIGGFLEYTVTAPPSTPAGKAELRGFATTTARQYVDQAVASGAALTVSPTARGTLKSGRRVSFFSVSGR